MKDIFVPNATLTVNTDSITLTTDNISACFVSGAYTITVKKEAMRIEKLNFAMAFLAVKDGVDISGLNITEEAIMRTYGTHDYIREIAIVEIL